MASNVLGTNVNVADNTGNMTKMEIGLVKILRNDGIGLTRKIFLSEPLNMNCSCKQTGEVKESITVQPRLILSIVIKKHCIIYSVINVFYIIIS